MEQAEDPDFSLVISYCHQTASFDGRRFCFALKTGAADGSRRGSSLGVYSGPDLRRKPVASPALDGLVRMILHSGNVDCGIYPLEALGYGWLVYCADKKVELARSNPEHQKTLLEKLLPYHPEYEKKIGRGVDYITIGYHPQFEGSRCLFIVQTDGELIDFSYWKCIKGLIPAKYPLFADSFVLRHFGRPKGHRQSTG
ncbi:hypothetical protein Dimus_004518 [Dionaea muscipula]